MKHSQHSLKRTRKSSNVIHVTVHSSNSSYKSKEYKHKRSTTNLSTISNKSRGLLCNNKINSSDLNNKYNGQRKYASSNLFDKSNQISYVSKVIETKHDYGNTKDLSEDLSQLKSNQTTTTTVSPTENICTPFWKMPSVDEGTQLTYTNANPRISGDHSRSACVTFRANISNTDQIVFDIGSNLTTGTGGCNTHFALSVLNNDCVTIYGMCGTYDTTNICAGQNMFYNGYFHQVCATYDNSTTELCIYLDLHSPQCHNRTNPRYQTGLGDARIGWWTDNNRQFTASGGGLIKWLSLFDQAINQSCVTYQYQINFNG